MCRFVLERDNIDTLQVYSIFSSAFVMAVRRRESGAAPSESSGDIMQCHYMSFVLMATVQSINIIAFGH